jgi:hypothetical protein
MFLSASCSSAPPVSPPVAPPAPVVVATPPPAPVAKAASVYSGDWRDWPVTPGTWVYRQDARGSIALFGVAGADAEVTLLCDRAARVLYLSRKGGLPGNVPMIVRTSSMTRDVPSQPSGGEPAYMATAISPGDVLLDAIDFSRGRFIIEQQTLPTLVVPVWGELSRVTEDCRTP